MPKVDPALLVAALAPLWPATHDRSLFSSGRTATCPPRGNLGLAWQFADTMAALARGGSRGAAWRVASGLATFGPREAPTGDPGEFVAFCGTLAAAGFTVEPDRRAAVWEIIRGAGEDERWRLREAAAQAVQRALPADPGALGVLEEWAARGSWLLCRTAAAGLADPPLLRDEAPAAAALRLHQGILARFTSAGDRRAAGFKVLRRGLGYTLSVVVAAAPVPGFALLRRLAAIPDHDLGWVLRSNLGKGRLARAHPKEVEAILALLAG